MSKFLEIVESNNPEVDLDSIIEAKRELQRMLIKLGLSVQAKVFSDVLFITLPDKRVVELEIKGVKSPKEEEAEDPLSSAANAIVNFKDTPTPTSSAGRKIAGAKTKIANAADAFASGFANQVRKASLQ